MFCPQCGSTQAEDLKFCKACGANLAAVRKAVTAPAEGRFDWNKTWVAEMLLSGHENTRRAAEIERLQGKTPETKRRNEIKGGVITASAGAGIMITLLVLMQGIILGGYVSAGAAAILSRVWVAGVIPIFVGFALVVNGMFISKKGDGTPAETLDVSTGQLDQPPTAEFQPPTGAGQLGQTPFSVTDETTKHLEKPVPRTQSGTGSGRT